MKYKLIKVQGEDALSALYDLKKTALMANSYLGDNSYSDKVAANFFSEFGHPKHIEELIVFTIELTKILKEAIPQAQYDEWWYADYEAYTESFHHRKFWNEIPNDVATKNLFNYFVSFTGTNVENPKYRLCLYDFNDEDLLFETEEDLQNFMSVYDCAPATVFRVEDDCDVEEYTI